jgi:hypothetical protein
MAVMTSREAYDEREAKIEAFMEYHSLPPDARIAIEEIIEADRIWAHALLTQHRARALAQAGS